MILAIDPGKSGGVAVVHGNGSLYHCWRFDHLPGNTLPRGFDDSCLSGDVVMEEVSASRQMSQAGAFAFGRNVGQWESFILEGLYRSITYVTPQKWQFWIKKHYYDPKEHPVDDAWNTDHKKTLQRIAWKIWPEHKKQLTLATCDAALLGLYWVKEGRGKV